MLFRGHSRNETWPDRRQSRPYRRIQSPAATPLEAIRTVATLDDEPNLSVSVVIPWGTPAVAITRAIGSALSQDLRPQAVFVLANNRVSHALLTETAQQYANQPVRFLYVPGCRNANVARNLGTALAKTPYVAYLDADDWWCPAHLRSSLSILARDNADLIYSGMTVHHPNARIEQRVAGDWHPYGSMEAYCLNYQAAQTSSLIARTDTALDIMWDVSLCRHQDYDFNARFARSYKTTFKQDITVHVDWEQPRRHRHHDDCFRVLKDWRPRIGQKLYQRHYVNLCRTARRSRDPVLLRVAPMCITYWFAIKLRGLRNKLLPPSRLQH
jgi:glycosyltransferase involved in cell wall biosynthesis